MNRSHALGFSVATVLVAASCGGNVTTGAGGSGGGSTSATAAATTGTTAATGTTSSTGTTAAATGTGGSGGGGAMCGGIAGLPCAADEYCDFLDDSCGAFDSGGTCQPRPVGCPKNLDLVCACDGKVYDNPCAAGAAGNDINTAGGCPDPIGQFGCGPHFCGTSAQYCMHTHSDVASMPDSYTCNLLPAGCTPMPTCACLPDMSPCTCAPTGDGGLEVSCMGK